MEIILKKRNIENVEDRLKPIVMVLQDCEEVLSDGYGYYCEYFASEQAYEKHDGNLVVAALEEIARRIMEKLDEQH
jgi:3-deoxy-D-manno-octulosonate 8-phosphate phosphatase KdsC-like HAD superfamily phosphatase